MRKRLLTVTIAALATLSIATAKPAADSNAKFKARCIAGSPIVGTPEGIVDISSDSKLLFIPTHGGIPLEIPYRRITSIEIAAKAQPRSAKPTHYVAVSFTAPNGATKGVVLELGSHVTRPVLNTLTSKSARF